MSEKELQGLRLLLVEDDTLIALDMAMTLERAGAEIVGPAMNQAEANRLIAAERIDGALLDGNLDGAPVEPVAAALAARDIPFGFVTGYDPQSLPAGFQNKPVLRKPFSEKDLIDAARLLAA